jgi:two-component system cell cycle sensor histidine kinase PleC
MRSAFENAFTCAPIGMALVDMGGRLLRVNDAFCRIIGSTAEEVCTQPFRTLSDAHDVEIDARQMTELLNGHSRRIKSRSGSGTPGAIRSGCS